MALQFIISRTAVKFDGRPLGRLSPFKNETMFVTHRLQAVEVRKKSIHNVQRLLGGGGGRAASRAHAIPGLAASTIGGGLCFFVAFLGALFSRSEPRSYYKHLLQEAGGFSAVNRSPVILPEFDRSCRVRKRTRTHAHTHAHTHT